MGVDIYPIIEIKNLKTGNWEGVENSVELFNFRDYPMYSFFAGIRNEYRCEPIFEPKGLPEDSLVLNELITDEPFDNKIKFSERIIELKTGHTYFLLGELINFNYDKIFGSSGKTYKDMLDPLFFEHLKILSKFGQPNEVRLIVFFDNC